MAGLTYGSQTGVLVDSFIVGETLGDQSQQTGNNQIVLSDDIVALEAGSIGDGTNGYGATYVGRKIVKDAGLSTQETRRCVAETAGTTTTYILTVDSDWDAVPVATTGTGHVYYDVGDIVDGLGSGLDLNTKSGLFEGTNYITVGNATDLAGLQIDPGQGFELDDKGANITFIIENNGFLETESCQIISYNGAAGEQAAQFKSGSYAYLFNTLIWSQKTQMKWEHAAGSNVIAERCHFLNFTQELHLYDSTIIDCYVTGKGGTSEIVRVDDGTVCTGLVCYQIDTLDSAADTTTETITLKGVVDAGITDIITLRDNKTWNMINPVWLATTSSDFNDAAVTGTAVINDKRSVDAVVQEADGTKLQDALVNVYEDTQLADLVQELTTDADGIASGSFEYKAHDWSGGSGSTTTYGGHALQCGKWLYLPFVAAQISTDFFDGVIVLSSDNNITQTTQATALSDGSTITWNEDTNPSSLIDFTGGSGGTIGLAVGDTITGASSTADGIVTEIKDGDGTAGTIHLKTRDANDFTNGETIGNGGDGWTATYTASTQQDFSMWDDGQTIAYTGIYDYLAAKQNETTLSADGEKIWEWCRSAQTQPLYATGSSFYTEQSNSKGVIIVDGGSGTLDYFTDDAGATWTPPTSVTVEVTVLDNSDGTGINLAHVQLYLTSDYSTVIISGATNASGYISASYTGSTPVTVAGWARQMDLIGTDYTPKDIGGDISSGGLSITTRLDPIT